jgi:hypothetical protein
VGFLFQIWWSWRGSIQASWTKLRTTNVH